jgi:hypothetical protein
MTEQEWLACDDPTPMLEFLKGKASDRKLRLFAVACCGWLPGYGSFHFPHQLVRTAELFADGLVDVAELVDLRTASYIGDGDAVSEATMPPDEGQFIIHAILAAEITSWHRANPKGSRRRTHAIQQKVIIERRSISELLRCAIGNPFRSVSIETTWHTSTVLALANGIYEEKALDRMPILADALQDADCDNEDILNHCRQPGDHVRGCFVVDRLLGKG